MTGTLRTQVCIIGSGPAGLLLSQLLHKAGVDSIIVDRQSREHIEGRIRAGVLEAGSVATLIEAGAGDRLQREGLSHDGFDLAFGGERHRIDLKGLTGKQVTVYGQTEVTRDLIDLRLREGGQIIFSADDVTPYAVETKAPRVSLVIDGERFEIACDYIAGCDGFHGVSRKTIHQWINLAKVGAAYCRPGKKATSTSAGADTKLHVSRLFNSPERGFPTSER